MIRIEMRHIHAAGRSFREHKLQGEEPSSYPVRVMCSCGWELSAASSRDLQYLWAIHQIAAGMVAMEKTEAWTELVILDSRIDELRGLMTFESLSREFFEKRIAELRARQKVVQQVADAEQARKAREKE